MQVAPKHRAVAEQREEISQPQSGWYETGMQLVLKGQRKALVFRRPFRTRLLNRSHQPLCGWLISIVAPRQREVFYKPPMRLAPHSVFHVQIVPSCITPPNRAHANCCSSMPIVPVRAESWCRGLPDSAFRVPRSAFPYPPRFLCYLLFKSAARPVQHRESIR
jgi:hypothetical protein